ncbi:hypothetical protein PoMZ_06332, partial [Pyricularia oryzae]
TIHPVGSQPPVPRRSWVPVGARPRRELNNSASHITHEIEHHGTPRTGPPYGTVQYSTICQYCVACLASRGAAWQLPYVTVSIGSDHHRQEANARCQTKFPHGPQFS